MWIGGKLTGCWTVSSSSCSVCASAMAPLCLRCLQRRTTSGCRTATLARTPAAWGPTAPPLRYTPPPPLSLVFFESLFDTFSLPLFILPPSGSCAGEPGAAAANHGDGPPEDCGRDEGGGDSLCGYVLIICLCLNPDIPLHQFLFFFSVMFQVCCMQGWCWPNRGQRSSSSTVGLETRSVRWVSLPAIHHWISPSNKHKTSIWLFQVLLPLLKSDLYEVILNTMSGKLASSAPVWHLDSSAVTVVMASAGYPGSYNKGVEITGTRETTVQQLRWTQEDKRGNNTVNERSLTQEGHSDSFLNFCVAGCFCYSFICILSSYRGKNRSRNSISECNLSAVCSGNCSVWHVKYPVSGS